MDLRLLSEWQVFGEIRVFLQGLPLLAGALVRELPILGLADGLGNGFVLLENLGPILFVLRLGEWVGSRKFRQGERISVEIKRNQLNGRVLE